MLFKKVHKGYFKKTERERNKIKEKKIKKRKDRIVMQKKSHLAEMERLNLEDKVLEQELENSKEAQDRIVLENSNHRNS